MYTYKGWSYGVVRWSGQLSNSKSLKMVTYRPPPPLLTSLKLLFPSMWLGGHWSGWLAWECGQFANPKIWQVHLANYFKTGYIQTYFVFQNLAGVVRGSSLGPKSAKRAKCPQNNLFCGFKLLQPYLGEHYGGLKFSTLTIIMWDDYGCIHTAF